MKEKLIGGLADGKKDSEFDKDALSDGTRHELEHTKSKKIAKEIAKDHLAEDAKYYIKLEKIEKSAKKHKYIRKYKKNGEWIYIYHDEDLHRKLRKDEVVALHDLALLGHETSKNLVERAVEFPPEKMKLLKELADLGHKGAIKRLEKHKTVLGDDFDGVTAEHDEWVKESLAADAKMVKLFNKGSEVPESLNGVAFSPWDAPKDTDGWKNVAGQNDKIFEPEWTSGSKASSGCIIEEPDGRVWIIAPTNAFGGYKATYPKGRVDDGLSMQANAIKEVFEETGLQVEITGFAKDVDRSTGRTRYYTAKRVGGTPIAFGPETEGVMLVPKDKLKDFLNKEVDHQLIPEEKTPVKKPDDPKNFDNWSKLSMLQIAQEYNWEYKNNVKKSDYDPFPTIADFEKAVNNAKVETLTKESDLKISNRSRTKTIESLKSLVNTYKHPRDVDSIIKGFTEGAAMPYPIVLESPDGSRKIMSGNTRTDTAFIMGINPKVLIIKIPSKKDLADAAAALEAAKANKIGNAKNLTELEAADHKFYNAVRSWTGSGSGKIREIQKGKADPTNSPYAEHLKELEEKHKFLPEYKGEVKRVIQKTPQEIDDLFRGEQKVYVLTAFSSFAKPEGDFDIHPYHGKRKVKLICKNNNAGRLLGMLSLHKSEAEILVPKGTRYNVLKMKEDPRLTTVWLEEILDKSEFFFDERLNDLFNSLFDEPLRGEG